MTRIKYALILYLRAVPVALIGLLVWPILAAMWAVLLSAMVVTALVCTAASAVDQASFRISNVIADIGYWLADHGADIGTNGFTWQSMLTLRAPFTSVTCASPRTYAAVEFARLYYLVARTRATEIRWRRASIVHYRAVRAANPPEEVHYAMNSLISDHTDALRAMGVEP